MCADSHEISQSSIFSVDHNFVVATKDVCAQQFLIKNFVHNCSAVLKKKT